MKKNILPIFLSIILIILTGTYFISLFDIKNSIKGEFGLIEGQEKEWTEAFKEYEIFQCKFGILNTEYVFVSHRDYSYRNEDRELWKTTFYNATRSHLLSLKWLTKYTGGTTITNTTFPQLVKMVKEDCGQFQEDYDNPDPENGIDWGYREAEPPKTEKELEREELRAINSFITTTSYFLSDEGGLTQAQKDRFVELYGDFNSMSHEERVILAKEVLASGGVDESVLAAE